MRLSIRIQILLVVSTSLIFIFSVITYLLVVQNTTRLRSNLNEESKSFAALSVKPIGNTFALYKDSGTIKIIQQVNSFLELDPDVTAIRVVDVNGKQLYSSDGKDNPNLDSKLASSSKQQVITNQRGYIDKVVQPFFEDSGAHRYSVVYRISTKRIEQSVNEVIKLIVYAGAVILMVSIAATGLLLNTFFIKPLRKVSESANIISSGDFDHKIVSGRHDEIGDLANSVEKMAENLKADIEKLRELDKLKSEFMMITSHNLRTPLTIIQGYIDLAKSVESSKELKSIIDTIQESVSRLHLLAENVLTIATLEAGQTSVRKAPTPLSGFLDTTVNQFRLIAEKKSIKWNYNNAVPADTSLDLNTNNMRSALGNLVDNAIKFSKSGGDVNIDAKIDGGQLTFTVADKGVGISDEEKTKLFTKFHRGTSTLNYDYEGIGIGLYLTKLIIEQHGGKINVQSELNKGSTFVVTLPLTKAQPQNPATNA